MPDCHHHPVQHPRTILLLFPPIPPPPTSTLFPYTTLFRSRLPHLSAQVPLRARRAGAARQRPHVHVRHRDPPRDSRLPPRSEEHTSELQSHSDLVCRLLLEKKKEMPITDGCANALRLCCAA